MRLMAIDHGDRRTGIAVGEDELDLVSPLTVIEHPTEAVLIEKLLVIIEQHGPDLLIIGLPLNMDGSEGPRARMTRKFGERLAEHVEMAIAFQDERLTSFAAERTLAGQGHSRQQKRRRQDALAAAEIMQDYLQSR